MLDEATKTERPHDEASGRIVSGHSEASADNASTAEDTTAWPQPSGKPPENLVRPSRNLSDTLEPAKDRPPVGPLRRRPGVMLAVGALVVAAVVGGTYWWLESRHFESTDDAFIDSRIVPISPQVAGAVMDVAVTDNQLVEAGAVLFRIDDRDYRAAFDQAKAQIEQAQANVEGLVAQIDAQKPRIEQAQKQVAEARAALIFAEEEYNRAHELLKRGSGTEQRAQQTSSDLHQKQAAFNAAQAAEVAAEKQIAILEAQRHAADGQLEQARAQQAQAEANLGRTTITAPVLGRVAKLSAAKGAFAPVGQALMTLVPRDVWVTGNFKETQLTYMRPGQPVDIRIDAYPDRPLHGHVDSVQSGSGAAFSLLPPENATGNYVKVVQRVPVKIVFDETADVLLGPGMSVVPTVRVR
jgi:membrane fusion protein (multidrug efflux system)